MSLCTLFVQLAVVTKSNATEPNCALYLQPSAEFDLTTVNNARWDLLPMNNHSYTQGRSFFAYQVSDMEKGYDGSYESHIDPKYFARIKSLRAGEVIVDGGAGKFKALADLYWYYQRNGRPLPKFIGIVDEVTEGSEAFIELLSTAGPQNFAPILGYKAEDVDQIPKGSVTLIVDIFGAFTYTHKLDQVLLNYLNWLRVGGEIYIYFPNDYTSISRQMSPLASMFMSASDNSDNRIYARGLKSFLRNVSGISCEHKSNRLIIKKVSDEVRVPRLVLVDYDDRGAPPFRAYDMTNDFLPSEND